MGVFDGSERMTERRATLMNPRMEDLLDRVGSRFTLVTLAAMRAREINDYYNHLSEGLGKIVPPQVTSLSRKPVSIALEEIEAGKIEAVPLPEEGEAESAEGDGSVASDADLAVAALSVVDDSADEEPLPGEAG